MNEKHLNNDSHLQSATPKARYHTQLRYSKSGAKG